MQTPLIGGMLTAAAVAMPAGKNLSLEKFQSDVQQSLGKNFGQFVEATKSTSANGFHVLRITAVGVASELPVQWIYYHIGDNQGRRVSFVFTLEQKLAERFAAADVVLTRSVEFTAKSQPNSKDSPTPATAGRSTKSPENSTAEPSRR